MKRRNFIKNIGIASSAPLMLQGMPLKSYATSSMLPLLNCQGINDRVLVVVFLKGANDGVNTIIPINQYDDYVAKRPNIKLENVGQPNGILNLDSTLSLANQVGIHPSMTKFKEMYDAGKANLIQAVGYPLPNKSHFKATDLWLSGGDGTTQNFNIDSGWIGRFIESAYPGIQGISTPEYPDPLGIQFGDQKPSNSLHNHEKEYLGVNLSGQNISNLYGLLSGIGTLPHSQVPVSDFGAELSYIMNVENSTNSYGSRISSVYNSGSNSTVAYPNSDLATQLKSIARLMKGGIKTKVFLTHKSGFDTHVNQVVNGATHTGTHAGLLADVFNSIHAFHADLAALGLEDKVVTVTFSEFGRKVIQNGSFGTDHGNFAPMFMFGPAVTSGVVGNNITINNVTSDGNLFEGTTNSQMQHDYRQVFKTILKDWLGANQTIIDNSMFGTYSTIGNLIDTTSVVASNCYINPICYNYVTRKYDGAKGSLRDIISCASSGNQLKIAISENLPVSLGSILINKSLHISTYNAAPIVQSNDNNPIFTVQAGHTLTLENLELKGNSQSATIINNGNLILKNCTVKSYSNTLQESIINTGNITIQGSVNFKRLM
jgi:uncharacterized protein (DUF1501 family)